MTLIYADVLDDPESNKNPLGGEAAQVIQTMTTRLCLYKVR